MPSSIGAKNPIGPGETDSLFSGDTFNMVASFTAGAILFIGIPLLIAYNVLQTGSETAGDIVDIPAGGGGL